MTLTELRYIVELADTRHVGRAAQRCNVSQPNLSVSVKKLEEALGVVLFERTKSGVHPTPLGLGIIAQARRVLQSMEGIQQLADAGRELILDHLAWRLNEGYKARSTARFLSGVRGFYRYLLREKLIGVDPTLQVDMPQLGRPLPKSLSEADVEALLQAPDLSQAIGQRVWLVAIKGQDCM